MDARLFVCYWMIEGRQNKRKCRSSYPKVFSEKDALKTYTILTVFFFSINLQGGGLQLYLGKDSSTGVFLRVLQHLGDPYYTYTEIQNI